MLGAFRFLIHYALKVMELYACVFLERYNMEIINISLDCSIIPINKYENAFWHWPQNNT